MSLLTHEEVAEKAREIESAVICFSDAMSLFDAVRDEGSVSAGLYGFAAMAKRYLESVEDLAIEIWKNAEEHKRQDEELERGAERAAKVLAPKRKAVRK